MRKTYGTMVFINVMWGLSFIFSKQGMNAGFQPMGLAFVRYVLAAAALIADGPITVTGAECISKSWPGFVDTSRHLGGISKLAAASYACSPSRSWAKATAPPWA